MKITGYNAVVNPNTINAGVRVSGDLNAYGGKGNGARAVSNALGKVQAAYEQVAEEEDKRALMSAMDIYNKGRYDILYNDENGVLNTKLEGAAGSVGNYLEREKKLRNDILGNMKFRTEKYKLVFQDMVGKSAEQGYQLVDRHEYKEMEAQKDLTLNNNLENMLQFAQKNYGDDDIVANAMDQGRLYIAERFGDRGKEFLDKINSQFEGKAGEMLINQAVMAGEFDRADELKSVFDEAFTADQRAKVERLLFAKKQDQYEMSLAQELASRYGSDLSGVMSELESRSAFGSDRPMDLRERQTILGMVQNINNTNKAIKTANDDRDYNENLKYFQELAEAKKVNYTQALQIADERAGSDPERAKRLKGAVAAAYNIGKGIDPLRMYNDVENLLKQGVFNDLAECYAYFLNIGASNNQLKEVIKEYDAFKSGSAIKWDKEFKKQVMGNGTLSPQDEAVWQGVVMIAKDKVYEFTKKEKRPPTYGEVLEICETAKTKGVVVRSNESSRWFNLETSDAELELMGVRNVSQVPGSNIYHVELKDGQHLAMSGDDFYERFGGGIK